MWLKRPSVIITMLSVLHTFILLLQGTEGGLIGSWPLGAHGPLDLSGHGNDAVLHGTGYTPDSRGRQRAATRLQGDATSYISISNQANGLLDVNGNLTIIGQFEDLYSRGWLFTWLPCSSGYGNHVFSYGDGRLLFRVNDRAGPFIGDGLELNGSNLSATGWKTFGLSFEFVTGRTVLKLTNALREEKIIPLFEETPQCTQHDIHIGGYSTQPNFLGGGVASFCLYDEALDLDSIDLESPCGACQVPCCSGLECRLRAATPQAPFASTDSSYEWKENVSNIECGVACLRHNCRSLYYNMNGTCLLLSTVMPPWALSTSDGWHYYNL